MSLYVLDIETTGLEKSKDDILLIGLYEPVGGYQHFRSVDEFRKFDVSKHRYVAHNGAFDFNFLRFHGLDLMHEWAYCTRELSRFLLPGVVPTEGQKRAYSLENLFISCLGGHPYKLDRSNMKFYTQPELQEYNKKDCEITWALFDFLLGKIDEQHDLPIVTNWVMPHCKLKALLEYEDITVMDNGWELDRSLIGPMWWKQCLEVFREAGILSKIHAPTTLTQEANSEPTYSHPF